MNINLRTASLKRGFTLLELLIVIAIIAILSVIVVLVLNPAETLKKTRDAQRISDLNTVKTALGLYVTTTSDPRLDNTAGNTLCKGGTGIDSIFYSYPNDAPGGAITDANLDGGALSVPAPVQVANINLNKVDGTGWIKVNLAGLIGGSPLSNLPIDPTNTIANLAVVDVTDLVYRYMCNTSDVTFEINANLESAAYTTANSVDNKEERDGGNNTALLEVGTKLDILTCTAGVATGC